MTFHRFVEAFEHSNPAPVGEEACRAAFSVLVPERFPAAMAALKDCAAQAHAAGKAVTFDFEPYSPLDNDIAKLCMLDLLKEEVESLVGAALDYYAVGKLAVAPHAGVLNGYHVEAVDAEALLAANPLGWELLERLVAESSREAVTHLVTPKTPLHEQVVALLGTSAGRAALARKFGRRIACYCCCGVVIGPSPESVVLSWVEQYRLQHHLTVEGRC